jgi:glutathione S-transferase
MLGSHEDSISVDEEVETKIDSAASTSCSTSSQKPKCIFFDLKHSNNAARIRLWLRFMGMPEQLVEHRLVQMADLQTEEYAAINPCRKVPALITDKGLCLFEASVIMGYLEDRFGHASSSSTPAVPNFVLDTADERAFVNLIVRVHDLYIASPNSTQPNFSHTQGCMYLDPTPTDFTPARRTMDAATRAAKLAELYKQLCWLEQEARLPYLAGPRCTHADLAWFPTIVFMEFMLPISFAWSEQIFHEHEHFPKLTQWYEHCLQDAQFQLVREEILEDHREARARGRLSGVQQDVANHPEFKWKYM